jgi:hypothetical protein
LLLWADISRNFCLRKIDKILILFGLRAGDLPRGRQNLEAKGVIGKILGTKDLEPILWAFGAAVDLDAKFTHMPSSLLHSGTSSKGCPSQSTN